MTDSIATRRALPRVVILDEDFAPQFLDANPRAFGAQSLRDAAKELVDGGLDRLTLTVDDAEYVLRVASLRGSERLRYAMFVERRGSRRPLLDAYERFALSPREVEVLGLIVDGASNRRIADALCITAGTVQDHVRSLCRKCGAKRRGDLLAHVFGVQAP